MWIQTGQVAEQLPEAPQAIVAQSSGEAELYSLTKGSAQILGMISLAKEFGLDLR